MQVWPKSDTFTENATAYGTYLVGYARLVPWTSDAGSGDAIAQAVGNLHSGYFTGTATLNGLTVVSINGARRAAIRNTGASGAVSCFVWRPVYQASEEARLGVHWTAVGATPAPVSSFRFAMVGVRIAGQGEDTTAGAERLTLGDGYWLVLRNVTSQPGAKFYLLRVNAGVTTKLAESALVDVATLRLTGGVWISLRATGTGATVTLRCRRGAIGREALDGSAYVDIFGADVSDSDASRLTAAGRAGFGMAKPESGGCTVASFFEIRDGDSNATLLRDEWDRANYQVGAANTADTNGKSGRYLMPWYASSVGGIGNLARRDAGNNRVKNAATAVAGDATYVLDFVSCARASDEAIQRRSIDAIFATASGKTEQVQIELRGKNLHTPTAANASCYRAEMESVSGSTWTFRIYSIQAGVATLLASKTAALSNGTHVFDFDAQNVGGFTSLDGDPNLIVRLGGSALTGWTLAGVAGVEQLSNGTVIDRRTSAIRRGWEQGWRFRSTPQTGTPTFAFDNWTDAATLPATDFSNRSVSGETDGATGTLTAAHSWKVEETHRRPTVVHEYDSDHAQRLALGSRNRRTWKCEMPAAKQSEADAFDSFWDSHKGHEIPFTWSIEGESVTGAFVEDSKEVAMIGRSPAGPVYRYSFAIEERFAS